MPRFEPFPGIRYANGGADLADVVAPPYDVIDPPRRARLAARRRRQSEPFSRVERMTPSPCSSIPVTSPQSSSGSTSAIQTKRQRSGPLSKTWADAL